MGLLVWTGPGPSKFEAQSPNRSLKGEFSRDNFISSEINAHFIENSDTTFFKT